jgi:hypothetical protein
MGGTGQVHVQLQGGGRTYQKLAEDETDKFMVEIAVKAECGS